VAPQDSAATALAGSSLDDDSSLVPLQQSCTRLQNNIVKPKRLFPGMIKHASFCSTDEPDLVKEVLADPHWKQAMDGEYATLMQNGTWHLVPVY
jgi:hypothetical protein